MSQDSNKTTVVVPFDWLRYAKSEEEKQGIILLITNNTRFTDLILSILKDKYESLELQNHKKESYQDPNNLASLAFDNGRAAAYMDVANLFKFRTSNKN